MDSSWHLHLVEVHWLFFCSCWRTRGKGKHASEMLYKAVLYTCGERSTHKKQTYSLRDDRGHPTFTKQMQKTVEFVWNWDLLWDLLHLSEDWKKVQKFVWSLSNCSLARSEGIYTSFWKLIFSCLSTVKTDFYTQSPQQSIFPWQCKSVEPGGLGYEERNISIALFNS